MRQYLEIINENSVDIMQQIMQKLIAAGIDPERAEELISQELSQMSPDEREEYFVQAGLLPDRDTRMSRPRNANFPSDPELDKLFQSKDNNMDKNALTEEINISGSADELLQLMKLAGAAGAEKVTPDTISQGPELEPCSTCGKMHDPESGGCGSSSDMGDYIRMISSEAEDYDGDFDDASTEPDEEYMNDVSASIPNGNDLNRRKKSYGPTNGADNPMALEDEIRAKLAASLAEKMKNKDQEVAEDDDPCWKGYEMIGMKKKNGREVPNCVPKK